MDGGGGIERLEVARVRAAIAGQGATLETPFGRRPLVYADYGASGRACTLTDPDPEDLALYANPHNEDSACGRRATARLEAAAARIKARLGADADHRLIACGDGSTAAIQRFREIMGVALPPATRAFLEATGALDLDAAAASRPVAFVGPFEHHSNELGWRESLAETVRIGLDAEGGIDLQALDRALADPRYAGRRKIGAFAAASNVTGVRADVAALTRTLHRRGAILFLDCAASAPYGPIDMSTGGDPEARIDALALSPHKFVGGPGSCGLLLIDRALYRDDLPPTVSGGGTVRYVTAWDHDYLDGIEARERAGTPGLPQLERAAAALDLPARVGWDVIEARERAATARALSAWTRDPLITVLGPPWRGEDPARRTGLVSMSLAAPDGGALHPRLAARLLNDLFGVQARAGCACAGPYGHDLLGLDREAAERRRRAVADGCAGLRPGFLRVSLHWTMSEAEIDYLIRAVAWTARNGRRMQPLYAFDPRDGRWRLAAGGDAAREARPADFETAFAEADRIAEAVTGAPAAVALPAAHADLCDFAPTRPVQSAAAASGGA